MIPFIQNKNFTNFSLYKYFYFIFLKIGPIKLRNHLKIALFFASQSENFFKKIVFNPFFSEKCKFKKKIKFNFRICKDNIIRERFWKHPNSEAKHPINLKF